jgi:hypothetical protein
MRMALIILVMSVAFPWFPAFTEEVPCPYSVYPHALQGIGLVDGDPTVLVFTRLFPGQNEDRTVAEFDITAFKGDIQHISLVVEVSNSDQGGDVGEIQLHTYIADGVITPSEFYAGVFHSSVPMDNPDNRIFIVFDVTSTVLDAVAADETYLGTRLNAITDRYWVYSIFLRCEEGTPDDRMSWGKIKSLAR